MVSLAWGIQRHREEATLAGDKALASDYRAEVTRKWDEWEKEGRARNE